MWQWLKKVLWENRNEPLVVIVVIFFAALLIVVLFALVYQIWYRQAPLYCKGMLFPSRATDCPGVTRPTPPNQTPPTEAPAEPTPPTVVPVGTIVPYLGNDDDIPPGWVLCDGRDNPSNSQIRYDADSERGGIQLPDLRHKFIRGSKDALSPGHVREGGRDTISLKHAHLWAHFGSKRWESYNQTSRKLQVDKDLGNGMGDSGKYHFPLIVPQNTDLYTNQAAGKKVSTLPRYVELRFIIKIF